MSLRREEQQQQQAIGKVLTEVAPIKTLLATKSVRTGGFYLP